MNEEVRLVEWGVANNFGDCIEIHKDLPKYPLLYDPIMRHEKGHSSKSFTLYDLIHDLRRTKGLRWIRLLAFMLRRPKTWIQVLPLYYRKDRGFVYDLNLTIIYILMAFMVWILTLLI